MKQKLIFIAIVLLGGVALFARHPGGAPGEIKAQPKANDATQSRTTEAPLSSGGGFQPESPASPRGDGARRSLTAATPTVPNPKTPHPTALDPAGRPNLQYKALYLPHDQSSSQWYINKIAAPAAWDRTTGSAATTVAVIDTGFGLQHDELVGRWAYNTGEMGGGKESNGIDDDANSFVDDWRGWDFYHEDNVPQAGSDNAQGDAVSHGTSTAGLVGAAGNNSLGVSSINWQTRLLPLQALNDNGDGFSLMVAQAMHYAVDRGANVISMSLGVATPDDLIKAEIDYATAHNVLVVAAAGNDGCNCMVYPANYPEVLSVGATDQNDKIAWFSSYGANLDVVAPGSGLLIAPSWAFGAQQSAYSEVLYGTSFATPIVSGLAAMVKGLNMNATPAQIADIIRSNADTVPDMTQPGQTLRYGTGRINAYRAVVAAGATSPYGVAQLSTPLYKAFKPGEGEQYTTDVDRLRALLSQGYQYEIVRPVILNKLHL